MGSAPGRGAGADGSGSGREARARGRGRQRACREDEGEGEGIGAAGGAACWDVWHRGLARSRGPRSRKYGAIPGEITGLKLHVHDATRLTSDPLATVRSSGLNKISPNFTLIDTPPHAHTLASRAARPHRGPHCDRATLRVSRVRRMSNEQKLRDASKAGNVAAVRELLGKGTKVNAANEVRLNFGRTTGQGRGVIAPRVWMS